MALPPRPAQITQLHDGLRIVLADNPSAMTFWGTNSYVVGTGDVAVIDPGPDTPAHIDAILGALGPGERVSHIFVTHAHLDHSPGAARLRARTGAPVHAFGDAFAGRSPHMEVLAAAGGLAGGEGVDADFRPDISLPDGAVVANETWSLEALWTPGHFGNHLAFAETGSGALFCGDIVMGWASSLVSPPDGDLSAFLASLDRLSTRPETIYYPGHGQAITDPRRRVSELRAHREMRSAQIRSALCQASGTAQSLAARIYLDTPAALLPAAARNVLAHLIDMEHKNEAVTEAPLTAHAVFSAPPE